MAYTLSQRINEIGIRIALGAGAGLFGSLVQTRFLQSMLFSVKPTDPATFTTIAALLAAATLLACLVPAHRATRVDPLIALRHE